MFRVSRHTIFTVSVTLLLLVAVGFGALLAGSLFPSVTGYQLRVVETGSMAPTIPTGAVIIVRQQSQYVVGDIVIYQRRGEVSPTTHRIIGVTESGAFVTQGDANNTPDMTPVELEEVFGYVAGTIPGLGYLLYLARQPIGFLALIIVPAILLGREQWLRIKRVRQSNVTVMQKEDETKQ